MIDDEIRAYIDARMTVVIAEAVEQGIRRAFVDLGVDVNSADGVRSWHECQGLLRSLVKMRNKAGNVVLGVFVAAVVGWAGLKLWPTWWPK